MAVTAQTIVEDALTEIAVLTEGSTASGKMASDSFRALNRLMEVLSNIKNFAYVESDTDFVLTGQASFTIGPTGDVVGLRPIKIDSATATSSAVTYPVRIIDKQEWDSIEFKTSTATYPDVIYYEATMDDGIAHLYPQSTATLHFNPRSVVKSFATLATALDMPPGYEECLIKNLAVNISPQYPAGVLSPITVKAANDSMKVIKDVNGNAPTMTLDLALQMGSIYTNNNILTG